MKGVAEKAKKKGPLSKGASPVRIRTVSCLSAWLGWLDSNQRPIDSGSIDAIESWLDEISWNSRTRFLVAFSHCRLLGACGAEFCRV